MTKHLHVFALLILFVPVGYVLLWTTAYQEVIFEDDSFYIEGFMGEEFELNKIDTVIGITELPKIYSSAGISLKGYEKGFFTRFSDHRQVKIIAHHKKLYIKIVRTNGKVVFYNADTFENTQALLKTINNRIIKH